MSWTITIPAADRDQVHSQFLAQAAETEALPESVVSAITEQLTNVPEGYRCSITTHGHLGWGENQGGGTLSCYFSIEAQEFPQN